MKKPVMAEKYLYGFPGARSVPGRNSPGDARDAGGAGENRRRNSTVFEISAVETVDYPEFVGYFVARGRILSPVRHSICCTRILLVKSFIYGTFPAFFFLLFFSLRNCFNMCFSVYGRGHKLCRALILPLFGSPGKIYLAPEQGGKRIMS